MGCRLFCSPKLPHLRTISQQQCRRQQVLLRGSCPLKLGFSYVGSGVIDLMFVFQGVIVGSGLDWASDNDMKRLVLSLGEVLEFAA